MRPTQGATAVEKDFDRFYRIVHPYVRRRTVDVRRRQLHSDFRRCGADCASCNEFVDTAIIELHKRATRAGIVDANPETLARWAWHLLSRKDGPVTDALRVLRTERGLLARPGRLPAKVTAGLTALQIELIRRAAFEASALGEERSPELPFDGWAQAHGLTEAAVRSEWDSAMETIGRQPTDFGSRWLERNVFAPMSQRFTSAGRDNAPAEVGNEWMDKWESSDADSSRLVCIDDYRRHGDAERLARQLAAGSDVTLDHARAQIRHMSRGLLA